MLNLPLPIQSQRALELIEKSFAVFALLFFAGALLSTLEESAIASEAVLRVALPLFVLAVNCFLVALWHRQVLALVRKEKLLWVLLALALASALWSEEPTATLRRFLVLLNASLFGVFFAVRYSVKEQLRLLGWTFGIAAVLSVIFIWGLPHYGVMGMGSSIVGKAQEMTHRGTWRGVFPHKNVLGTMMVLSTFVFFLLARSSRQSRWVAWAGCSLSVGLVIGSTSITALAILGIVIVAWGLFQALRWFYLTKLQRNSPFALSALVVLLNIAVTIVVLGLFNLETMLNALGRDLSFSGRTELWSLLIEHIWERPWLGYGYGGFWLVSDGSQAVRRVLGDWAAHAHNGWLDLWLDLGFLGLSIFIYSFLTVCVQALLSLRRRPLVSLWALTYLTFLVLCNVTESVLFNSLSIFCWLLYVTIVLSLHKEEPALTKRPAESIRRLEQSQI
ncbi:MAG: O-antigen ligase family protein [Cyanophyceae cyanobacterium]